jgi:hypothetical protein
MTYKSFTKYAAIHPLKRLIMQQDMEEKEN